jgi:hypothetical protein
MGAMRVRVLVAGMVLGVAALTVALAGDRSSQDPDDAPVERADAPNGRPGTTNGAPASDSPPAVTPPPTFVPEDPDCPPVPARAEPDPDRPRYRVDLDLDPGAGAVTGTTSLRFTPDLEVDALVLRLWANGPRPAAAGARIDVLDAQVGGSPVPRSLPDPTTLVLDLPRPVGAGEAVVAELAFRLEVPAPAADRISRSGDGPASSMRLGSFLPLLAWEPGRGWATDPPTSGFAEAATSTAADWSVGIGAPEGVDVLATGRPGPDGRWQAIAARDFAVSAGRFRTAGATVDAPHPVEVTVGVHEGIGEDPADYLARVSEALIRLAGWYGPYPWETYSLAITPDLRGGIEFPGHVMQGPGSIGRTTPHEVAHMWFYGLVGNNQARHPWLDEGLATWAEGRLEGTLDDMAAQAIPAEGRGRAGAPMEHWETRQDAYYRSVYVQPAVALRSLAPPERIDCALAHYVARHAHRIATPADLLDALALVHADPVAGLAPYGLP